MKVQYVNDQIPRSDHKKGKPQGITLFQEYEVIEIHRDKYVLLNDEGKLSRYSQNRFIVSCERKVPPVDHVRINELMHPLRMEIKRLREHIANTTQP